MTKTIINFREESYGLFLDLAHGGSIGVDRLTGNIFLDEGEGPDCYHGAVIHARDVENFVLTSDRDECSLLLRFGKNSVHCLGTVSDFQSAFHWVREAQKVVFGPSGRRQGEKRRSIPRARHTGGAKLHVYHLTDSTTETDLQSLFGKVGKVWRSSISHDRTTGKSRGYGSVTMAVADARIAVEQFDGQIFKGKKLTIHTLLPIHKKRHGVLHGKHVD